MPSTSKDRLETVLQRAPTPIIMLEMGTARVLFANEAAGAVAGGMFTPQGACYCTDADGQRLPSEQLPGIRAARGEKLTDYRLTWHTDHGDRSFVLNSESLPPSDADPGVAVLALHDVTAMQGPSGVKRVLESAPVGISLLDTQLRYEWVNRTTSRLVGLPPEALVGRSIFEVYGPETEAQVGDLLRSVLATGEPVNQADFLFVISQEGRERVTYWDFAYQPVKGPDGATTGILVVAQDVTGRNLAMRELQRQRRLDELIIDHAPAAISYLDRQLTFQWANPYLLERLGLPRDEVIGHPMADVLGADVADQVRAIIESGKPGSHPPLHLVKGRETHWELSYQPVFDEHGRVEGVVLLASEVSDRVAREQLQAERIALLEQQNRYKDQFLGIISHELRTPINGIMGFVSLMDDQLLGPVSPLQREYLGKVLDESDRLLVLVNNLIDMSAIQLGRFALHLEPTDLNELCVDAINHVAPLALAKGVSLTRNAVQPLPLVPLDKQSIWRVLVNLLDNAVKFTPGGGRVTLAASTRPQHLYVEVRDSGIGIPAPEREHIFEPFVQADMSSTRVAGGTGLGLAISKHLVEAHGGQLGVDSTPGQGSTFWVSLPAA